MDGNAWVLPSEVKTYSELKTPRTVVSIFRLAQYSTDDFPQPQEVVPQSKPSVSPMQVETKKEKQTSSSKGIKLLLTYVTRY